MNEFPVLVRALSALYIVTQLQLAAQSAEAQPTRSPVTMQFLTQRKHQQELAAKECGAFYGFQFTNRLEESGIQFENRVVDDAGKNYQAAHYDHGNGLAVADID